MLYFKLTKFVSFKVTDKLLHAITLTQDKRDPLHMHMKNFTTEVFSCTSKELAILYSSIHSSSLPV